MTSNFTKIYVALDGTIIDTDNTLIVRGSDSSNQIQYITPFDTSYLMECNFQLANGQVVASKVLTLRGTEEIVGGTYDGETWNIKAYDIQSSILSTLSKLVASPLYVSAEVKEENPLYYGGTYATSANLPLIATDPNLVDGNYANVTDTGTSWEYDATGDSWSDLTYSKTQYSSIRVIPTTALSVNPSVVSSVEEITESEAITLRNWLNSIDDELDMRRQQDSGGDYTAGDFEPTVDTVWSSDKRIATYLANYFMKILNYDSTSSGDTVDKAFKVVSISEASSISFASEVLTSEADEIHDTTTHATDYSQINMTDNQLELKNSDTTNADTTVKLVDGELQIVAPQGTTFTGNVILYNAGGNAVAYYDGIDVRFDYGGKSVEMAKNLFTRVKATVAITEGDVVQYTGTIGTSGKIEGKPAVQAEINLYPFLIIGVATENISVGNEGECNFYGRINDIDTTGYGTSTEGTILYYDSEGSTAGAMTATAPTAPNVQVKIALLTTYHATNGNLGVRPQISNAFGDMHDVFFNGHTFTGGEIAIYDIANNRWKQAYGTTEFMSRDIQNGAFKETFDLRYNTSTSLYELDSPVGNTLTEQFSDGDSSIDVTSPITVAPSFGSATVPVANYIYILQSNKGVMVVSTSSFPSAEHIKIAEMTVLDEVSTDSDGPLGNRNWNNHETGDYNIGSLNHIRARIRRMGAQWYSGVAGATSGEWVKDTAGTLTFTSTAGSVLQMHPQTYSAKDTSVSDDMHIVNEFTTPYDQITTFNEITDYSDGTAIGNHYFNVFVYGVINKSGEYSPVMVNTPTTGYTNLSDAQSDLDSTTITTVPTLFRETAFPIARIILRNQAGTYSFIQSYDLREQRFGISGTSGTGVLDGEFIDTTFELQNVTDTTKVMKFSASNQTTGTTRTLTGADQDVDMQTDVLTPISVRVEEDLTAYTEDLLLHGNEKFYMEDSTTSKRTTTNALATYIGGLSGSVINTGKYYDTGLGSHDTALVKIFTGLNTTDADVYIDILDTAILTDFYTVSGVNKRLKFIVPATLNDDTQALRLTIDSGSGSPTYKDVLVNGGTVLGSTLLGQEIDVKYTTSGWVAEIEGITQSITYDEVIESTYGVLNPTKGTPELDKFYGLLLNQEVTDGDFGGSTGWSGTVVISGGVATLNADGSTQNARFTLPATPPIGKEFYLSLNIISNTLVGSTNLRAQALSGTNFSNVLVDLGSDTGRV